jgi:hypothetical protein
MKKRAAIALALGKLKSIKLDRDPQNSHKTHIKGIDIIQLGQAERILEEALK